MAKPDRLSQYVEKDPILWKDRKRYLGLPISFTIYSFDNNRLYVRKGFFTIEEDEVLLYRILDIGVKKTFWQRIFGVGTVHLDTADQTHKCFDLKNVKNPERIKKALSTIVEKERDEKRVLGKEMYGASGMDDIGDFDAHE